MQHLFISAVLLAVVGSIHCVGMCGGFAITLAHAAKNRRAFFRHQALYHLGKTATYTLLGFVAGGIGGMLGTLLGSTQRVLSILLGIALVFVGIGLLGYLKQFKAGPLAPWRHLSRKMGGLLKSGNRKAVFMLGMLNGLLPCGLVYGGLALATTSGSAPAGAAVMAVFGASTVPALLLLASMGALLKPAWRSRLNIASGVIVVLLGLITIFRGISAPHAHHDNPHGETMHQASASECRMQSAECHAEDTSLYHQPIKIRHSKRVYSIAPASYATSPPTMV